jgi:hypothetical protein
VIKTIYDNGSSKLVVEKRGELITLRQEVKGVDPLEIYLYVDELNEVMEFVEVQKS